MTLNPLLNHPQKHLPYLNYSGIWRGIFNNLTTNLMSIKKKKKKSQDKAKVKEQWKYSCLRTAYSQNAEVLVTGLMTVNPVHGTGKESH